MNIQIPAMQSGSPDIGIMHPALYISEIQTWVNSIQHCEHTKSQCECTNTDHGICHTRYWDHASRLWLVESSIVNAPNPNMNVPWNLAYPILGSCIHYRKSVKSRLGSIVSSIVNAPNPNVNVQIPTMESATSDIGIMHPDFGWWNPAL